METINNQLKIKRIGEMKNPIILISNKDLEVFTKDVEVVGESLKYNGILIIASEHIEQGNLIVYDESKF